MIRNPSRFRVRRAPLCLLTALAACAGSAGREEESVAVPNQLSPQEVERIRSWDARARRTFPLYVNALTLFSSTHAADVAAGEQMLERLDALVGHPVEADLRRALHAADPREREAARRELARRGLIFRHWLALQDRDKEGKPDYGKWIAARQAMLALGDDAADLLIDTLLKMLPGAAPEEQLILRDELAECGTRAIPVLVQILDLPAWEQSAPLRLQCMLVLARFADQPLARGALERYARTEEPKTRRLVPQALRSAYRGTRSEEPRALLETLLREDPSWEVRAAAAEALGDIGNPNACPALVEALGRGSPDDAEDRASVNKFVVAAIGKLKCASSVEPLVVLLEGQKAPELARKAVWALHQITGEYFATPAGWRAWLARSGRPK